jgi:transglutaminase 1
MSNTGKDRCIFQFEIDVYLLCNPWMNDDIYALSTSEQIAEYVMNEHGRIYIGSMNMSRSIPWYFGQFEASVFHAAMTLLDRAPSSDSVHIDESFILRYLCSQIRSNSDDNASIFLSTLNERSSTSTENNYASSTAILKQYLQSNSQGTHYGSNWQHAAVLCSLCRSLGIPCRVVTIYNAVCGRETNQCQRFHSAARILFDTNVTRYVLTISNSSFSCV